MFDLCGLPERSLPRIANGLPCLALDGDVAFVCSCGRGGIATLGSGKPWGLIDNLWHDSLKLSRRTWSLQSLLRDQN
eukprot:2908889-Amphidinium_carterae.1